MRAALAKELDGIDSVELSVLPEPVPGAGQVLVRCTRRALGRWTSGASAAAFPGWNCRSCRGRRSPTWWKRRPTGPGSGSAIGAGTAYEGLVDRGQLQAGETVLITAAAGGVGSVACRSRRGGLPARKP